MRSAFDGLPRRLGVFTSTCDRARNEIGKAVHDGGTEFFVRDDGVAFNNEHIGQLFKPFQRLHRADEFPATEIGIGQRSPDHIRHGGPDQRSERGRPRRDSHLHPRAELRPHGVPLAP